MWVVYAFLSALCAGLVSILAKSGIRKTDSTVATAIRTIVVLVMSVMMVGISGSYVPLGEIPSRSWIFLVMSGIATGASWLCYFRALQAGSINKVVPIDKSSTVLTILLAFLFLHEPVSPLKLLCVLLIAAGTFLMIEKKEEETREERGSWLPFALGSAVFAALTSILGKIGIQGVPSTLGTAIRTAVVLVMAWAMVLVEQKGGGVREISRGELGFLVMSGIATGASWLCYYQALQDGLASVVVPIDKLSMLVSIAFSNLVFHEKLHRRCLCGLVLIVVGTLLMLR